jgi:SAM-dependent methyltransferase
MFRRRGLFPIYSRAARMDNCNYHPATIWNRRSAADEKFRYHRRRPPGTQFFEEATDMGGIPSEAYDFLLSCHMLEHSANPLKALKEWKRVLKPEGLLFLALPHKDGTFDHRRPVTPLQHLVADYEQGIGEDDLTHLQEILELHDLRRDPDAGNGDDFRARSRNNFENRALHHHVFDTRLAVQLVTAADFQIRAVEAAWPVHIAILATKAGDGTADNEAFLRTTGLHFSRSPFPSDHVAAGGAAS